MKSIKVKADCFLFDSKDKIVLLNKDAKELNYFNIEEKLIESIPILNYMDGLNLMSLSKDDEPVFFDTAKKLLIFI